MKKQEKQTYILTVYNTMTGLYEDVEVSEEVYCEYRRGQWRINKNEDKHRAGEIPFSVLLGGDGGEYENFSEFADDSRSPELLLAEQEQIKILHTAMHNLPEEDRELLQAIFFEGLSEREYAKRQGVSQPTVHWKKVRILKNLKKFFQ